MSDRPDDSTAAVLRRRYKGLREEGYNEKFCSVLKRAADELDAAGPPARAKGYWTCPCCQSYYTADRIVCPVSGDNRPAGAPVVVAETAPPPRPSVLDRKVTVCSSCLCACCWQGDFYCEGYRTAGTVIKTVRELAEHSREDAGFWFKDASTGKVDYALLDEFRAQVQRLNAEAAAPASGAAT